MKTNYLKKYIISSYILVWALIIFVAGTASLVFHAPPVIMWIVRNLIAWSPTYLLLIGWKHFRPDETRRVFIKRCFTEYYPPWEPPVSRFRATRKWYFLPSEPPQHIVAAHIFDFTINLLIVILGELLMQYHQIIYREVFLCLRRQKSEVFWNFWEKI